MRVSYTLLAFCLLCLSVTVQRRDVKTQEWKAFPSVTLTDLSQDQQTYIVLFLTHVVVAVWIFFYVNGTDTVHWNQSSSKDTQCKEGHSNESDTLNVAKIDSNTEHLKNDNEEWNGVEMQASTDREQAVNFDKDKAETQMTEQLAMDNDDDELNDSYLSNLVDCIRVMISQAANEKQARSIIHQAISEEFPKYFGNDKVINCLLALSNNLGNGNGLESEANEAAGVSTGEQKEKKTSLLIENVAASQEEDHEYISAITDEELQDEDHEYVSAITGEELQEEDQEYKSAITDEEFQEEDQEYKSAITDEEFQEEDQEYKSAITDEEFQEEDQAYKSAITDEELIYMISDILSNSCEKEDSGAPYFSLEDHDALETLSHRPVSPMDKEEEDQHHEEDAKESKIGNTDEDRSVEMSSSVPLLDQMHLLYGSASEGSYLESTDSQRPMRKEDLDRDFSWPSLPGQSRVPSENEFDRDTDAFSTAPRHAYSTPTCVITTSSCHSCKDAEHELQSIELTPAARFLPTTARLSLSGSLQGSLSDVLSKLTQAKRSGYKRNTTTAKELWHDSQEEQDTSIFNASFSISSLEDILSPERIPPSPSSPVFGSPEKSLNGLGIRLHKPAGFKDIFLSIVDRDKKTGIPRNVSDTWTLGTREEMELILHVDSNPHQNTTKAYSGRYCLVFNDISDLEEHFSNEDSQEDFWFSMLCNDGNSREECISASDKDYEGFLSCTNVDDLTCEEDQEIVFKISQANDLHKCHIIALESEEEEERKKEEELLQNEKSDHDNIKTNGSKEEKRQPGEELPQDEKGDHDQSDSAEKVYEVYSRDKERIFAFACLALTSYLAHRYLK